MECLSDINQKDEIKIVINCPSDGLIDNVLIFPVWGFKLYHFHLCCQGFWSEQISLKHSIFSPTSHGTLVNPLHDLAEQDG